MLRAATTGAALAGGDETGDPGEDLGFEALGEAPAVVGVGFAEEEVGEGGARLGPRGAGTRGGRFARDSRVSR